MPRPPPEWGDKHGRRAHRTGHPASPRQGSQRRRYPAQPGADIRGRNPGRCAGAGGARDKVAGFVAKRICGLSISRRERALGAGGTGADVEHHAPSRHAGVHPGGHRHGRGGRRGAGGGRGSDRRREHSSRGTGIQIRSRESAYQCQEPVLAARGVAAGQIDAAGGAAFCLRGAAHRASVRDSALLGGAARVAGRGRIRPARSGGMAAVRLGGDRLHAGMAKPRVAPEDEQAGSARRDEGNRGIAADPQPHPRAAAPDAAPQGEGRCVEGRGGADQSHPLCGGAGF